eukprot:202294_1
MASESKQSYETAREEIKNKNLDIINVLKVTLDSQIEDLEKQFDDAHQSYVENTEDRTREFKDLKEEDKKLSKQIEQMLKQIEKLQGELSHWKQKIMQNDRECTQRNQTLRSEKEAISRHYRDLKRRMTKFRSIESKRLLELTKMSRSALAENERKYGRAEKILKLAELARKYEMERERVEPFYGSSMEAGETQNATIEGDVETELAKTGNQLMQTSLDDKWGYLDSFYRRYNAALLDKLGIEHERTRLKHENEDLRAVLKQYLDGITVTSEAVDTSNPLLVVNGRVDLAVAPARQFEMTPVIEARQVMHNYNAAAR